MPGLLLHQAELEGLRDTPALWPAGRPEMLKLFSCLAVGLTDTFCLLHAALDCNLVFWLLKLSNGFKKLSGDMKNERKTE